MTPCDQCTRGWVPDRDWYAPCPICNGLGVLTSARLAKIFDLDELTVKYFWTGRRNTRRKTLEKILTKACAILEPKRAKQLRLIDVMPPSFSTPANTQ